MVAAVGTGQMLGGFGRSARAIARALLWLALAAAAGIGALALSFARRGFSELELVASVLFLAAPAVVLLFAAGLHELAGLPERLLRMPQRSSAQLAAVATIAAEARSMGWRRGWRRLPRLLWRARPLVSSTRDLFGFALPLRVLAPPFLALTAAAIVASTVLVGAGLIALVGLAVS